METFRVPHTSMLTLEGFGDFEGQEGRQVYRSWAARVRMFGVSDGVLVVKGLEVSKTLSWYPLCSQPLVLGPKYFHKGPYSMA